MSKICKEDIIFIAGANGMAGRAIKKTFIKNGYNLLLTPNRSELNLLDLKAVQKWFTINKPTVVVIAAAKVGGILANTKEPTEFLLENLKIQINLIETSWKNGVKRLLFLGSSCIYPKFATQPIEEEELLSGSLEKTNQWYAIAKIAGIKLCDALRAQYNFDAISIMPTNLYGPGDNYHLTNSHVLPAFIRKFHDACNQSLSSVTCWGSGSPLREFLHVDDLGEACVFVLENWSPTDKNAPKDINGNPLYILNVGTGKDLSLKELSEKISLASGFKGDILWDKTKPDGTPKKQLDVTRINSLGWKSKISLDEGIKNTINLYRDGITKGEIRI